MIGWLLPPRKHKHGWYTVFQIHKDSGITPTGGGPRWDAIAKRCSGDPYAIALWYNVHRRHLTAERKRDLIAELLKAKPEQSNRSIAQQVKADDKTVAMFDVDLEATAEIPQLEKTVGADGKARKQPSKPKDKADISHPTPCPCPMCSVPATQEQQVAETLDTEFDTASLLEACSQGIGSQIQDAVANLSNEHATEFLEVLGDTVRELKAKSGSKTKPRLPQQAISISHIWR